MLYLPCEACGQPRPITEIGAWVHGAPFCGSTCVAAAAAAAKIPELPEPPLALARASEAISAAIRLVRQAGVHLARADRAAADGWSNEALLLTGLLIGGAASLALKIAHQEQVEGARGRSEQGLWSLDQQLLELVRRLMVLHELGYPIVKAMEPLVTTLCPAGGSGQQLRALHDHLTYLERGVLVWLDQI